MIIVCNNQSRLRRLAILSGVVASHVFVAALILAPAAGRRPEPDRRITLLLPPPMAVLPRELPRQPMPEPALPTFTAPLVPPPVLLIRADRPPPPVPAATPPTPVALPASTPPHAAPSPQPQARPAPKLAQSWQARLLQQLERCKRYPADARSRGIEGATLISFSLDAAGRVASSGMARSSGSADLDAEAMSLLRCAGPFPPPPEGITLPVHIATFIRFTLDD